VCVSSLESCYVLRPESRGRFASTAAGQVVNNRPERARDGERERESARGGLPRSFARSYSQLARRQAVCRCQWRAGDRDVGLPTATCLPASLPQSHRKPVRTHSVPPPPVERGKRHGTFQGNCGFIMAIGFAFDGTFQYWFITLFRFQYQGQLSNTVF